MVQLDRDPRIILDLIKEKLIGVKLEQLLLPDKER